jgi:hypothetical protein
MLNSSGSVGINEQATNASMAVILGDDDGPEPEREPERDSNVDALSEFAVRGNAGKAAISYGMPVSGDGRLVVFGEAGGERPNSLNADLCLFSAATTDDDGVCPVWAISPTGKDGVEKL